MSIHFGGLRERPHRDVHTSIGESGVNTASGVGGMSMGGIGASDVLCVSGVSGTEGPGEAHMGRS